MRIDVGLDADNDGELSESEIQTTEYVECAGINGADGVDGDNGQDGIDGTNGENGDNGLNTLVIQTDEAAGENCQNGGVRIDVGLDADNDGELSDTEIQTTEYVCAGINGTNGTNGENGDNGLNPLVTQTDEAAGDNCQNGGVRIDVGLDADNDGELGDTEIQSTEYVCAGNNGEDGMDIPRPEGVFHGTIELKNMLDVWATRTQLRLVETSSSADRA